MKNLNLILFLSLLSLSRIAFAAETIEFRIVKVKQNTAACTLYSEVTNKTNQSTGSLFYIKYRVIDNSGQLLDTAQTLPTKVLSGKVSTDDLYFHDIENCKDISKIIVEQVGNCTNNDNSDNALKYCEKILTFPLGKVKISF